jgi:prolyl-tRNA editing enzyme YbaK/EbsC (Cys-tRNA(Pro) deacylase)
MNPPSKLLNYLRTNGIDYEIIPHAQAFTARMAAAAEGIDRHHQAKVVIIKAEGQPIMAVLPADRQLNYQNRLSLPQRPVGRG